MTTYSIRLLSIIFFASFISMLFWHYFTQRFLPEVKQNPASSNDTAASNSGKVKQNPGKSNDTAASNSGKVKQNPAKNNDAAASDLKKVKQNPAKSK
ncbi:hypothetical protein QTP70_030557 [Hemibagrus guttatus]|uniref:Uncharacterized protein n=1 Tax=Hemibagrus guttatus TaxID=175788 RepID=A0AAE0QHB8_9TELE|nr:hypothetical protein QTP70_030557 [Hemibagrus guttatus]